MLMEWKKMTIIYEGYKYKSGAKQCFSMLRHSLNADHCRRYPIWDSASAQKFSCSHPRLKCQLLYSSGKKPLLLLQMTDSIQACWTITPFQRSAQINTNGLLKWSPKSAGKGLKNTTEGFSSWKLCWECNEMGKVRRATGC